LGLTRPRQGAPQEDDVFGRPKFTIPKFLGKDAEEYLNWEMRIEALWCLHECTDDRKIRLVISEFVEYAMSWWDNAVSLHRDNNMIPIVTWRDMKVEMWHCFVPPNYTRSLYDKLKQVLKPVDEYYQEMELIMQRTKVRQPAKQTLQRFLSRLTYQIRRIVRYHPYNDMAQLLHQAREAEASVAEKLNLRALLQLDHVFCHGHHQQDNLPLVHEIQQAWEVPRRPQLPSQVHLLPSPWCSLQ
jgi:hypothetical protein